MGINVYIFSFFFPAMEISEMYALGSFLSRRIFDISSIAFLLVSKQGTCGEGYLKMSFFFFFFSLKVIH